jgi:hypothetical protein
LLAIIVFASDYGCSHPGMPLNLIDPVETVTPPQSRLYDGYMPMEFRSMLSKSRCMMPSRICFTDLPLSDIW